MPLPPSSNCALTHHPHRLEKLPHSHSVVVARHERRTPRDRLFRLVSLLGLGLAETLWPGHIPRGLLLLAGWWLLVEVKRLLGRGKREIETCARHCQAVEEGDRRAPSLVEGKTLFLCSWLAGSIWQ